MTYTHLTTKLLGLKDQNIDIQFVLNYPDYTEIKAKLDYFTPKRQPKTVSEILLLSDLQTNLDASGNRE